MKIGKIVGITALAGIGLKSLNKSENDNRSTTVYSKSGKEIFFDQKGYPVFHDSNGDIIENDENGNPIFFNEDEESINFISKCNQKIIDEKEKKEEKKKKEKKNQSTKIKKIKINNGKWNESFVEVHIKEGYRYEKDWVGLWVTGEIPGKDTATKYGYVKNNKATLNLGQDKRVTNGEYTIHLLRNDGHKVLASETIYIE
ncbi:hypothetical protein CPAV1605_1614 [seawater metagenome]|uniref:Uncharacterized protein n=1 Tax=seawater metagenome TaxID=1561972 RepID=A0A5E8CMA1_9ZZZZ